MDSPVQSANAEAIEAWDGPLFDRFVRYRHIVVAGLSRYGDEALRLHPPAAGDRVLDIDEAVEFVMSLGPAGEILRLAGDRAAHLHEPVAEALREELADWAGPDGVIAPSSTWIVTARTQSC